jgi:excisionase family DNA binding protein
MTSPKPMPTEEKFYSVKEVAEIFQVTEQTIRIWINEKDPKKRLGAMKIGRSWRMTRKSLSDFATRQNETVGL